MISIAIAAACVLGIAWALIQRKKCIEDGTANDPIFIIGKRDKFL